MLQLGFIAFECKHHLHNGVEKTVGAIVGPIRILDTVNQAGEEAQIIFHGCSAYEFCTNPICGYSSVSRERNKQRRMEEHGQSDDASRH